MVLENVDGCLHVPRFSFVMRVSMDVEFRLKGQLAMRSHRGGLVSLTLDNRPITNTQPESVVVTTHRVPGSAQCRSLVPIMILAECA